MSFTSSGGLGTASTGTPRKFASTIDLGSGSDRGLLVLLRCFGGADPFTACMVGASLNTGGSNIAGGTDMGAALRTWTAFGETYALFGLAGASLPTGVVEIGFDKSASSAGVACAYAILGSVSGFQNAANQNGNPAPAFSGTVTTVATHMALALGFTDGSSTTAGSGATLGYSSADGVLGARGFCLYVPSAAGTSTTINGSSGASQFSMGMVDVLPVAVADTTPPNITSSGTGATNGPFSANLAENSTAAFITLTADESVTWGSVGGADSALFQKANATGTTVQIQPVSAFNFESLPHANPFVITLAATDGSGNATTVTLNTTITNVNEPPGAPTIGTATAGVASASVAFTPPGANGGPSPSNYTATSSPGGITGTGASSPIAVSGLTPGVAYTFTVTATNSEGTGPASAASNSVTPTAGAPTLSGGSAAGTGNGTAVSTVTTNGTSGTLYAVFSAAQPTNLQIKTGKDSSGAFAPSANATISSAGLKTLNLSGLSAGAATVWFLHDNGSDSNVLSASWTQPAALSASGTISAQAGTQGSSFVFSGANPSTLFSGGVGAITFTGSGLSGSGLTVNSSTGVPAGACGTPGTYNVVVTGTDQSSAGSPAPQTATRSFTLVIGAAGSPATGIAITPPSPSSGTVGVASANFTATLAPNGGTSAGVLVTPSDGGNGGSFSPASFTLSTGTPSATFTYTPASAGAKSISLSNNGGLSNPSPVTYTASAAAGSATTVTLTLTWDGATPAANVSGLEAAFFDEHTAGTLTTAKKRFTGLATDAFGVLSLNIAGVTSLAPAGIGWLVLSNSNGTLTQNPDPLDFAGPVVVA